MSRDARPEVAIEDTANGVRATIALLKNLGNTQPCATVGIQFLEPSIGYVPRSSGGVGGTGRETASYPD